MKIGHLDLCREVLIVAEIGNNHEGSYALAEDLIGLAAEAGADAVKFQTIVPQRLIAPTEPDRLAQLEKFCLGAEEFEALAKVARQQQVLFLSTPFDIESAAMLCPLVPAFKIASGDNNFFRLLEAIARMNKPVILSGGLADLAQLQESKGFLERIWTEENVHPGLAVLHCVSAYPTPPDQANLLAIRTLETLGCTVGYSDHTLGTEAAVLAVALGARIIEKHFTISKDHSAFRDHRLSSDPPEFRRLVEGVRQAAVGPVFNRLQPRVTIPSHTATLLGEGGKRVLEAERPVLHQARRSIVAARDLQQSTVLTMSDLDWLRPAVGLPPGKETLLIGQKLKRDVPFGHPIQTADVEPRNSG